MRLATLKYFAFTDLTRISGLDNNHQMTRQFNQLVSLFKVITMFLHISDTMTVEEVQDRFRECFPLLDIAFYHTPHKKGRPREKSDEVHPDERIAYIRDNHYNGVLEIKSWYSVARVEKELKEQFGLYAQVCRRDSDGRLVQTTLSDDFTLADQARLSLDTV